MKIVRVDIYKKIIFTSAKEGQKLNVFVVSCISPERKTKSKQFRINKTHNSRYQSLR